MPSILEIMVKKLMAPSASNLIKCQRSSGALFVVSITFKPRNPAHGYSMVEGEREVCP
jgi:hypothetical protein